MIADFSYPRLGLGTADPYTVVSQPVASIASVAAAGAATTGALLTAAGFSAMAGPIGLAVSAAIGIGVAVANLFKGCGQTCIDATNIVNQAEPLFQQNVTAYLAIPNGQRTQSIQAAYLNNFDTLWQGLEQACQGVGGQGGQGCISGREQGACNYKTNACGWQNGIIVPCGANGSGSTCWNWFVGYRDPIANDPYVVPDSSVLSSLSNAVNGASETGFPILPLLLLGIGGLVLMTSGD